MRTINFLPMAALAVACLATGADAAMVNIKATVLNGLYLGASVIGTLSYDDDRAVDPDAVNTGDETYATSQEGNAKLYFAIGPLILTELNDKDAPGFPRVSFIDGLLDDINYEVWHGVSGADLLAYGVRSFKFGDLTKSDVSTGTYEFGVEVIYGDPSEVPLPAGLPLLGGGLVLLGALRKRMRH